MKDSNLFCLVYETTGEEMRRKERRTTDDYEGTEVHGLYHQGS